VEKDNIAVYIADYETPKVFQGEKLSFDIEHGVLVIVGIKHEETTKSVFFAPGAWVRFEVIGDIDGL
jgi:D-Tyr-tRNAtyr deacylase